MKNTPVSKMQDSGIEWIGNVPEEWELQKISSLYFPRNEKVSAREYPPLSVTKKGVLPQLETVAKTNDVDNRKLVRKGDFAINSRSDRRGSCGISKFDGSVSLINTVLCPRENMIPTYFDWVFHTPQFSDEFYKWGHGIVDDLWSTTWMDMKKISVPLPPLPEQRAIADYLDRKCGDIDSILSDLRTQIETLEAYKRSLISESVTHGLNPNAKMKDSGIEWIGMVPEGWKVSRVGIHTKIMLGKMLCSTPCDNTYTLEPYFCAANIHFDGIDYSIEKQMWFSRLEKMQYKVEEGDLLVVEGGAGAGGCTIASNLPKNYYVQNSLLILRSTKTGFVGFIRYVIELLVRRGYIDCVCNKATIPHFTKEKVAGVPLPLPSLPEQRAIADFLDTKCVEIESLIADKQTQIESLEGYKKSLIFEVVTGKKRVATP